MWRIIMQSSTNYTPSIRDKLSWRTSISAIEKTSAVLLQSGSDDKWRLDSMECCCCLREYQDIVGRREISKWTKIWWIFPGHALFAVCIWEEEIQVEKLDASEIYPRRLNAKEVLITHKDWEIVSPVADGSATSSGRDYEFQEPTLRREHTVRIENLSGESRGDREEFRPEESEGDAEAREYLWSFQGDFIYCHHFEPRVQLTCQEENHSLISQDLFYWTKLLREEIFNPGEGLVKSHNIWGKNNFKYVDFAGKGRNSGPCNDCT